MKKRIPAVILMFALFLSTSFAANALSKTINVSYGINVEFNDQPITMTDAAGKPVDAFLYQGTTYVPIRAISETFGAYVGYDSSTNTAYVYDDFTEIIVVAYKLNHIMFGCESLLDVMESSAIMNTFSDVSSTVSSSLNTINQMFERNSDMLNTVSDDNVNYSLLAEDLLPLYNDFVNKFNSAVNAYNSFSISNSYADASRFLSLSGDASTAKSKYQNELDSFLSSFNWRTF